VFREAAWIGVPREEIRKKQIFEGDANGRFVYFRHDFFLAEPGELLLDITASSR